MVALGAVAGGVPLVTVRLELVAVEEAVRLLVAYTMLNLFPHH